MAAVVVFLALAALPAVISGYPIYILPQYMLFGMLALSLALLWGHVGIVSFGQAAFFALGAYAMGLAMQQTALPVNGAYLGLLGSVALGGALAGIIGYFLFSAGVRGAYFVIVTLALSIIVEQLAVSQSQITGGWNGMFIDRMSLTFGPLGEISLFDDAPIYYLVLAVVAAAFALLKGLSRAPFGKLLVGVRENEDRLLALGVRTPLYKTGAFALSGAIACLAGALYGTHANFVAPVARRRPVLDRGRGVGRDRRARLPARRAARRHPRGLALELSERDHARLLAARARHPVRAGDPVPEGRRGRRDRPTAFGTAAELSAVAELLRTEGLTKRFQGLLANDSIDFRLSSGELRCVIGPNGAGKTTFISMISGHLRPTAGTIWYRGEQITQLPVPARARRGIGRKFQTPSVFDNQSVLENAELAVLAAARRPSDVRARIAQVLELVRLEDQAEILARNLSHGQRQWLEIGLLLANDAKLLLLDEPTAGMTAEETVATGQLVRRLIAELDVAAIIIEHDINFIRALRAPITVLHLGRVLVEGSFEEIERNPEVREVYLGGEQ